MTDLPSSSSTGREFATLHKEIRDARSEAQTASSAAAEVKGRLLGFDANDKGEIGELRTEVHGIQRQLWWLIGIVIAALVTALVDVLSRLPHG
jgi:hypothetical protein